MGDNSAIGWTSATWNPTVGCDRVSDGCTNCYALTMAKRLKAMGQADYQRDGDPRTSGPGFGLTMRPHMLDQPLRWQRPRRIFVNSMSDLFHDEVTDGFIASVFAVMALAGQHQFQVLTKRHGRMRALLNSEEFRRSVDVHAGQILPTLRPPAQPRLLDLARGGVVWPVPNVWVGVSVEDQKRADLRIPALLATPAAVRFLSVEPMLGPVDLEGWLFSFCRREDYACPRADRGEPCPDCLPDPQRLGWVIVGGESGRGARRMDGDWPRRLRRQCAQAGVPFFFKQAGTVLAAEWGCGSHKGTEPSEWPEPFPQDFPATVAEATVRR